MPEFDTFMYKLDDMKINPTYDPNAYGSKQSLSISQLHSQQIDIKKELDRLCRIDNLTEAQNRRIAYLNSELCRINQDITEFYYD